MPFTQKAKWNWEKLNKIQKLSCFSFYRKISLLVKSKGIMVIKKKKIKKSLTCKKFYFMKAKISAVDYEYIVFYLERKN